MQGLRLIQRPDFWGIAAYVTLAVDICNPGAGVYDTSREGTLAP
jgi:hypothetical protein